MPLIESDSRPLIESDSRPFIESDSRPFIESDSRPFIESDSGPFTECPIWNVGKADPAVSARIVSDVPVLILEGTFDAATAPQWIDAITPDLKNAQVVLFPFTGHSVLGKSKCALSIMTAFLANPTKPVDPTCAAQITLTFTTG